MDRQYFVEGGALVGMLIIIVWVFVNRKQVGENGKAKELNIRTIQHLALALIVPFVMILALEKAIDAQATVAIYGAIVGYVLGAIGNKEHSSD